MDLAPREIEKLDVYKVVEIARRRRERGTKLNVMGEHVVAEADCMPGVR